MIEESGWIVETIGDDVVVETSRRSSCGNCGAKGCGTGALSQILGTKTLQLRVNNTIGALKGEQVVLGISEAALVKGSLAVYIVPILALLAGGIFGEFMAPKLDVAKENLSIVSALGALGVSLLWLRWFNRRIAGDSRYNAVILRRADNPLFEQKVINMNK